ncbi:membrane-spanning 4-domains subfamily A member 6A isoform X3 [Trachypithecus francoisi]|nr:membrane-spanning 4-domains subfamily A member 6A isoform X3 [Trachypithecus francoisi]XP_033061097.1 membrane-spanning 4-domains subfamily A member 6A isoform X3 [Trachypithecus francoisi]
MTSQPVPNETVIVLPSNVISFSQAEKPEPTNQGQDSLKKRLQAEVKVIGTIQILCGMMVLSLGIILASASFSPNFTQVTSTLLNSAYPFIGPFFFIISGSLSIATEKRLTKLLVHSSLFGSILSALSALVGFIILSVKLAALNPALLQCELDKNNTPTRSYVSYYYHDSLYTTDCYTAKASLAMVSSAQRMSQDRNGRTPPCELVVVISNSGSLLPSWIFSKPSSHTQKSKNIKNNKETTRKIKKKSKGVQMHRRGCQY